MHNRSRSRAASSPDIHGGRRTSKDASGISTVHAPDLNVVELTEAHTPAGGSTHAATRVPPDRFAQLVDAKWVDVRTGT